MADISIPCPKCQTVMIVSEFVDATQISCRSCGTKLAKPVTGPVKPKAALQRAKPKLAGQAKEEAVERAQRSQEATERRIADEEAAAAAASEGSGFHITHHMIAWALFAVIGGAMGAVRYGDVLPPEYSSIIGLMSAYGWIVMVAFHLLILLAAFRDAMFQGMLCLLIPPYAFYYLFMVSDDFFLRAVYGGFLVGIGQDGAIFFAGLCSQGFDAVNRWIQTGGGG